MKRILVCLACASMVIAFLGCGAQTKAAGPSPSLTEIEAVFQEETMAVALDSTISTEPVIEEVIVEETVATEPQYEPYEYFSTDVEYEFEYISNREVIPHIFFQPSTAQNYETIPLIVWLHGSGEKNTDAVALEWSGLPKAIIAWDFMNLEGMNAYIVAPHLVHGDFWTPYWCTEDAATYITSLIDYYIEHYNIDPDQIVLAGHSLGGQGVAYLSQVLPDTFCAAAPLSVYHPCIKLTNKDIPMWCFQGDIAYGEDSVSIDYAFGDFSNFYGRHSVTSLPVSHGELPMAVFSMDNDGNKRTDLFEWFAEKMEQSKSFKEEVTAQSAEWE